MKPVRKKQAILYAMILLLSLILILSGCSNHLPTENESLNQNELSISETSLQKNGKGTNEDDSKDDNSPRSASTDMEIISQTFHYLNDEVGYEGGQMSTANGTRFQILNGAITPPEGTAKGEEIIITMQLEKMKDEMIFTFGPSGCTFEPEIRIWFYYSELNTAIPKLYYVQDDGKYVEQRPICIDPRGKRLFFLISHFSRYALSKGR